MIHLDWIWSKRCSETEAKWCRTGEVEHQDLDLYQCYCWTYTEKEQSKNANINLAIGWLLCFISFTLFIFFTFLLHHHIHHVHMKRCHRIFCCNLYKYSPVWGWGQFSPLVHLLSHLFPFLLFSFFHWLYLFSSFVHPFPFYQNSPTPFPGRRS